jgi:hypothetical protein
MLRSSRRLPPEWCRRQSTTARASAHSRFFWGLRLHLVTTLDGLLIAFALTNPKTDEREVLVDLFDVEPGLLAAEPGGGRLGWSRRDREPTGRGYCSAVALRSAA